MVVIDIYIVLSNQREVETVEDLAIPFSFSVLDKKWEIFLKKI